MKVQQFKCRFTGLHNKYERDVRELKIIPRNFERVVQQYFKLLRNLNEIVRFLSKRILHRLDKLSHIVVNPLQPGVVFLYPLKTSENLKVV